MTRRNAVDHRVLRPVLFVTAAVLLAASGCSSDGGEEDSVGDIADDAAVTDTIELDDLGSEPWGIAVSDDAVWVANGDDDALYRIDVESLTVTDTIEVASPEGVAVADDAVWVTNGNEGTVSRIDREALTVTDTFELEEDADPTELAVGGGFVWVLSPGERDEGAAADEPEEATTTTTSMDPGSVWRIDIATGDVTDFRFTDPRGLAVGEGAVWVGDREEGTVSRLDIATGDVTGTIDVGGEPNAIAVGAGSVWVTEVDGDVAMRIDPDELAVVDTIELDEPGGIAASDDSVWVAEAFDDIVVRIGLDPVAVSDTIDVGDEPVAIAVGAGAVWVANYGDYTVSRIA